MSTRCRIGIKNAKGSVESIYCHHDGYLQGGVGQMLYSHYKDEMQIHKLMDLGDISSLEETVEDTYDESYNAHGEDTHYSRHETVEEYVQCTKDIRYLYDDGLWYIYKEEKGPVLIDYDLIKIGY